MTTGKKTALSLLISVIIFSLSAIFLYSGVFEKIETRFYQPAVINGIVESLNTVEKSLDEYHRMNFLRFGDFLSKESVKVSFLPNPGQKAITERNGFTGKLFEQNPGLKGIRFIDFQGRGVHYSTYKNDVLATNKNVTAFKNYDQLDTNVRYQEISQEENSTGELFLDESKEEILYLLPFIDNYNAYQGTAVFYVSVRDLENFLVTRNLIKQGESLILFNSKENNLKGLVKSLSVIGKKLVLEIQNLEGIGIPGNTSFADENGNSYMLLTVKNSPYEIFTGEIANDELFLFPDSAKNLLLVTIVITVFLAFFLLFNIRQDSYSIIHQRVIELEKEIIREYINHRDSLTWDKLLDEMEMKKGAVSREIKKALGTGWKKHGVLIDDYFNESWEELISVLWEKKENSGNQESINEIKKMLEEILSKGAVFKSQEPSFQEKPENLVSLPAEQDKTGVEPREEVLEELPEAGEQEPVTLSEQAEQEKTGVEPLVETLEELPEAGEQEPVTLSEQAEQEKTGVEPREEPLVEPLEEPLEETLEELPEAGEQEPVTLSEQAEQEKTGVEPRVEPREEPLEETLEELPEAGEQEPETLSEQAGQEKTGVEPRVEPQEEPLEELPEAGEQEPEERRKPLAETLRDLDEIPSLSPEKKKPVPEVNVILDIGNINFSQLDNIKNTLVPEKTESYDTKENMNDNENGRAYIEDSEIPEVQEIFPDNKSWSFWLNSVGDFPDLSAPLYGETEELEVVGDGEEFAELLEINESESIQEDSNMEKTEEETNIILKDGVYQINPVENKPGMKINEDFLNLVNSIMKKSPL